MKATLTLLLPLLLITGLFYTTGCNDNTLTTGDTTTVANPYVKVYRNISVNEFLTEFSTSSIDLYAGTNLLANDGNRDAELSDSSAFVPDVFFVRSGDGSTDNRAPGLETRFAPFFNTRSATFTQVQFDAITKIDVTHDPLIASDFTRHSTYSFTGSFNSTDIRVYGFWLQGKRAAYGLTKEVYGLMYLKSVEDPGTGLFRLVIDIKINTNGQNDFRERVPYTSSTTN